MAFEEWILSFSIQRKIFITTSSLTVKFISLDSRITQFIPSEYCPDFRFVETSYVRTRSIFPSTKDRYPGNVRAEEKQAVDRQTASFER